MLEMHLDRAMLNLLLLTWGPLLYQCCYWQVEDVEFESAFEKMVMENIAERQRENRPQQRDIAVPMVCRQTTKKTYEQLLVSIVTFLPFDIKCALI